jgi:hypothetical protein
MIFGSCINLDLQQNLIGGLDVVPYRSYIGVWAAGNWPVVFD